jgi:hypothetical protein
MFSTWHPRFRAKRILGRAHGQVEVGAPKGSPWELYDPVADRAEDNGLARANSDLVQQMAGLCRQWSRRCNEAR